MFVTRLICIFRCSYFFLMRHRLFMRHHYHQHTTYFFNITEVMEDFIKANPYFKSSRLNSLYSDFNRLKQLNPDGYEANVLAWSNLLISLLKSKKLSSVLSIPTPGLYLSLSIPVHGRPDALSTVLEELVKQQIVVPLSVYKLVQGSFYDFIASKTSIFDYINPNKWLEWGLSSIGFIGDFSPVNSKGELKHEYYINWDHLITIGEDIHLQICELFTGDYTESLFDSSTLYDRIIAIEPKISKVDLEILMLFWLRDKNYITVREDQDNTYVKFGNTSEITDDDVGIINLKATVNNLTKRNQVLEHKLEEIPNKIKALLKSAGKQNGRVRNLLLTKKTVTSSLNKSNEILNQINTILLKINDTHLNLGLFESMKQSSAILKGINSQISVDEVDDLQNELDEEITKSDEINQALGTKVESDEEIEAELDKLFEEAKVAESKKKDDSGQLLSKLEDLHISEEQPESEKTRKECVPTKVPKSRKESGKESVPAKISKRPTATSKPLAN